MQAVRRLSFLSKNPSFSDSKNKVLCKLTAAVCESNAQRSRAFSASAPSDTPRRETFRKRVPLDERRRMVEVFVENYKTLNAGKFPTVSETTKQVGGSHYTIRKLVQELEHKSRTSHVSEADQHLLRTEVPMKEDSAFTKVEEITSTGPTVDLKTPELTLKPQVCTLAEKPLAGEAAEIKSSTIIASNDLEAQGKPQVYTYVENTLTGETAKPCDTGKEAADSEGTLCIDGLKEEVSSNDLEAKEVPTYVENFLSGETAKPSGTVKEAAESEGTLGIDGSDGSEEKAKSSTIITSNDLEAKEVPTYVETSLSGETAKPRDAVKEAAESEGTLGTDGLNEEVGHGSDGSKEKAKSSTIITSNDLEAKEVPTYVETSLSGETAKPSDTVKEAANSEALLSLDGSKEVAHDVGQEDLEGDKLMRNISSKESKEDPVPEMPNIWGKLRSFAGDVIKLWRKL